MGRDIFIENNIISLAKCAESDYKLLYASWLDEDTVRGYNYKLSYSYDEYRRQSDAGNWGAVVVRKADGTAVGRIGLSPGLPDLTVTIFKPYRKHGYGTAAFSLGIEYCFKALMLDRLYAGCYEDNLPSRKMIEKCGFTPHPEGNIYEKHIITGEDRLQLDYMLVN